jgi:hypothetical protein
MNMISKFAAASIAALSLAAMAAPANAAVYISFDGVTDAFVDLDDGAFNQSFGALGGFASVLVQGNAAVAGSEILHSSAIEVTAQSTAANLTVWVTRTGLSGLGLKQYHSYTNNNLGSGLSSTISQFYSTTNQKYGGTLVGTLSRNGAGSNSQNLITSIDLTADGTYSWTQKYVLSASSGSGSRSMSPTMTAAVPEPGTWALMIMGFGGAGAMIRSRRKVLAAV